MRIFPLPAERHPQQQRDHLQRPAQIAEIMHFPPRPPLTRRAAIHTVMHSGKGVVLLHENGSEWLRITPHRPTSERGSLASLARMLATMAPLPVG